MSGRIQHCIFLTDRENENNANPQALGPTTITFLSKEILKIYLKVSSISYKTGNFPYNCFRQSSPSKSKLNMNFQYHILKYR